VNAPGAAESGSVPNLIRVLVPGLLFNQEREFLLPNANSRTWFGL